MRAEDRHSSYGGPQPLTHCWVSNAGIHSKIRGKVYSKGQEKKRNNTEERAALNIKISISNQCLTHLLTEMRVVPLPDRLEIKYIIYS